MIDDDCRERTVALDAGGALLGRGRAQGRR
jgi:hypothetical protein